MLQRFIFEFVDFPQLPLIVPGFNSVSFSKSIITVVITSSVHQGKHICDSNVPASKPVSASFVCTSKPISNRNVRPSENVSAISISAIFCSSARASKPIRCINVRVSKAISEQVGVCGVCHVRPCEPIGISHARSSNIDSDSNIVQVKPSVLVMLVQVNLFILIMYVKVDLTVEVWFVKVNQLVILIFVINLSVETIFVSLIH